MVSTIVNKKSSYSSGICFDPHKNCFYYCNINGVWKLTNNGQSEDLVIPVTRAVAVAVYHKENTIFVINYAGEITKILQEGDKKTFASINIPHNDSFITGMAICQTTGEIFVSTGFNKLIFSVSQQGKIQAIQCDAEFYLPVGLFFDEFSKCLLVCDSKNSSIKRVSFSTGSNGTLGTVITLLKVQRPNFAVMDSEGTILITSVDNKIHVANLQSSGYVVSLLAGDGVERTKDGKPRECSFYEPNGIAVDTQTMTCLVAERNGIRKIHFA